MPHKINSYLSDVLSVFATDGSITAEDVLFSRVVVSATAASALCTRRYPQSGQKTASGTKEALHLGHRPGATGGGAGAG